MGWKEAQWQIPLDTKPTILQIGSNVHGVRTPVERFRLEGLWSLHLYGYEGVLRIGDIDFPLAPGHVGVVAPGQEVEYRYQGRSEHLYTHFALPQVPGGLSIPVMRVLTLSEEVARVERDLRDAIALFPFTPRPAEVRIWDLLWRLVEQPASSAASAAVHPAVQQVLELIEQRLSEGIRVADLAREVGLSHSHLTRLFRAAKGKTVVAYVQERRVERARHLLTYSNLPVKEIAARVGVEDLNLFNKTMRRHCGASPRQLRRERGAT